MSISEEIRDFALEANQNLLWQKQEEGEMDIVKRETRVEDNHIVKTLLKMGKRSMPRWTDSLPPTLKELYVDCYYEVSIQTIGGYTLSTHTKCIQDFMDADSYHYDLVDAWKKVTDRNEDFYTDGKVDKKKMKKWLEPLMTEALKSIKEESDFIIDDITENISFDEKETQHD